MARITEAYLQHGEAGGPYRTEAVEFRETEAPRSPSRTGYGSRLPTPYMVRQPGGRWRRVYAICWTNCASYFIGGRDGQPRIFVTFY